MHLPVIKNQKVEVEKGFCCYMTGIGNSLSQLKISFQDINFQLKSP